MVKSEQKAARVIAAVFAAMACGAVVAQEDVGAVRDRILRLESQVEIMQKEFNLEQMRLAHSQWRKNAEEQETGGMPSVVSVVKMGDQWQARLIYDTGATRALGVGDLIAPGVKLSDISFASVTAERLANGGARGKGKKVEPDRQFFALKLAPSYLSNANGQSASAQPSPVLLGSGMNAPSLSAPLPPPVLAGNAPAAGQSR